METMLVDRNSRNILFIFITAIKVLIVYLTLQCMSGPWAAHLSFVQCQSYTFQRLYIRCFSE